MRLDERLPDFQGPTSTPERPPENSPRLVLDTSGPAITPTAPEEPRVPLSQRLGDIAEQIASAPGEPEIRIPLAEWLPDLPDNSNPGATVATNVISRTDRSYGPAKALSPYSDALNGTGRAQGVLSVLDDTGNVNIFAGDTTTLNRLVSGSTAFEDVSRTSGGAYATVSDDIWSFAKFGERVIGSNFTDDIQSYVMGTDTDFSQLDASAPKARYIFMVKEFLFAANIDDGTTRPETVRWSAISDPTDWPVIGSADAASKQSDEQDLFDNGGWIRGGVGGLNAADGVIFKEQSVYRVNYIGPPAVFSILPVEGAKGTSAPLSIVQVGGLVYYYGIDGFYAFDGARSIPIGANKVDQTFAGELDTSNIFRISGAFDPVGRTVCWSAPSEGSASGTPNKIWVYHLITGRWSVIEAETEILTPLQTFGQTLEQLDSFGTMETLIASLDSRVWTGGAYEFGAFDTDHKLGYFTGATLQAEVETGEFDGQGRRVRVDGLRPIVDGGTVTASVGHRETPQGALTYTSPTSPGADGMCPQRVDDRYHRARIVVAAGGDWKHASAVGVTSAPTTKQ